MELLHRLHSAIGAELAAARAQLEGFCDGVGALGDYGVGTHTFTFDDTIAFPADPWRDLPTFDDDDPDHLPVL